MRSRNLACAALLSTLLIAGVAWWGERTHFQVFHHKPDNPPVEVPFVLPPEPPPPVEVNDAEAKPVKEEIAPPVQPEIPAKPTNKDFIEPPDLPRPNPDFKMDKIPTDGGGQGAVGKLFALSDLDQAPVATYQARPGYPESMKRPGISGEVTVEFVVDPNGKVRNPMAVHSSQRDFEEPACTAVGKWKFRPGRRGGHAVFVHMQVPIIFALSESDAP